MGRNNSDRVNSAYLVGGYIRDQALSLAGNDVDLAVPGDAQALALALANDLGGSFVPLGPNHGVFRVVAPGDDGESWNIDLAGFSGSIEEDLARRDFTINAMAVPLARWSPDQWQEHLIDPYNGLTDLADKRLPRDQSLRVPRGPGEAAPRRAAGGQPQASAGARDRAID